MSGQEAFYCPYAGDLSLKTSVLGRADGRGDTSPCKFASQIRPNDIGKNFQKIRQGHD